MSDGESTNPAVLADRLKRVELDILSINADISKHTQRLEYLANDKLSRDEFQQWTRDAQEWREAAIDHFARIDGRLGMWAGGSMIVTVISAIVAGIYGRGP